MARIRTIKPEFFKHEDLFELELETGLPVRLAFIGLWTICDREGRFKWRPRQIKTDVLPYDRCDFSQVLDALNNAGMVIKYEIDGGLYGYVPSFLNHQAINQREAQSVLPSPTDESIVHTDGNVRARARVSSCEASEPYEYRGVNIAPALRETVFARDGHRCLRCGATDDLTVDHIFPRSIGGTHALANLRTLCRPCNSARPVQGQALIDDLRADGFEMEDMAEMCAHVQAHASTRGREGKGREREEEGKEGSDAVPARATRKKAESNPLNIATWDAYANAFFNRYGTEPVRNAKVNGQIANLVKRLGEEAPHIAAFYVSHNKGWYVQKMHAVDYLLSDAESLRTQWATNTQMTESKARTADRMGNVGARMNQMQFDPEERF